MVAGTFPCLASHSPVFLQLLFQILPDSVCPSSATGQLASSPLFILFESEMLAESWEGDILPRIGVFICKGNLSLPQLDFI